MWFLRKMAHGQKTIVAPSFGPGTEHVNHSSDSLHSNSTTSLELDSALIEIFAKHNFDGTFCLDKYCKGNPLTRRGKHLQLIRMLGIFLVPILGLLALGGTIFGLRLHEIYRSGGIRETIRNSVDLSLFMSHLQRERDMSALYVSSISPETKTFLLKVYPKTDDALFSVPTLPRIVMKTPIRRVLTTAGGIQAVVNLHRYNIDLSPPSVGKELLFYSQIIDQLVEFFYESITEIQTGSVWKKIVALQHIISSRESLGLERVRGAVFYAKGGFESRDDFLTFTEDQDVARSTLEDAFKYSDELYSVFNLTLAGRPEYNDIKLWREKIRKHGIGRFQPSLSKSTMWYENVTWLMDALLDIQQNLLEERILTTVEKNRKNELETTALIGALFGFIILICPVIINAVLVLTSDIQRYSGILAQRTKELNKEKKRTDTLVYKLLPKTVALRLRCNQSVEAENYDQATLFFSDVVGFTSLSARSSPLQVVAMLGGLYTVFDKRIQKYDIYKVETIGDAYMVASGLPHRNGKRHAAEIAMMSIDLMTIIGTIKIEHLPDTNFRLRIGCHSGAVVAGVVGTKMPRYCLFGKTVNIASMMESSGRANRIHISETTYGLLSELGGFEMLQRTADKPNMKVDIATYWLLGLKGAVMEENDLEEESIESYGESMLYEAEDKCGTKTDSETDEGNPYILQQSSTDL